MKLSNKSPKTNSEIALPWVSSLLVVCLVVFTGILYINLGRDTLFDWDEGIYAELGRQLVITKNFFVTYWNGSVWFEKPPGIAWLSGLGQLVGGTTAFGARLLQPLVASAVLAIVYLIGCRLKSWRMGALAAGILATFNLFLGRTRAVNTDMPLLLGITSTVAALLYGKKPIVVALAIFVSVWFKGLAGLLPAIVALPLFWTKGRVYTLRTAVFTLALLLPWHLYAYIAHGEAFLTPYLREQVITRATSQIEFHFESRWFYFNYLYENLGLGVLLVAGIGAILVLVQILKKNSKNKPVAFNFQLLTLVWWVLIPLAIFTVARTRLFWYILPLYPALALLAAYAIDYFAIHKTSRRVIAILAVGVCLQAMLYAWRSVEPAKKGVSPPDRIDLVQGLAKSTQQEILVLVPPNERIAEAILPSTQRISSSFRYGGMPSVVYYYGGPVKFFYNVDDFNASFANEPDPIVMIHRNDIGLVTTQYRIIEESGEYIGMRKGVYANR